MISPCPLQEATADAEQRWAEEALAEVQAAEELALEEVEALEAREARDAGRPLRGEDFSRFFEIFGAKNMGKSWQRIRAKIPNLLY